MPISNGTQAQTDAVVAYADAPKIRSKLKFRDIVESPNVAGKLSKDERNAIGTWVLNNYAKDLYSRMEWDQRNSEAMKLALQMVEVKNFPWTNCANVKFPLVTIAALQFLARISILTKGRKPVKMETVGADFDGTKGRRAGRISDHMSYQIVDEDMNWMNEDEKAKFSASLVGSAIKKSFFDPVFGRNVTEHVPAQDFVWDYHAKHIDTCNRFTHYYTMSANKVAERIRRGLFLDIDMDRPAATPSTTNLLQKTADDIEGTRDAAEPEDFEWLEQHNWMDLDGDGYAEPYVMIVRKDTGEVARIVACFLDEGDVYRKNDYQVRKIEGKALALQDMTEKSKLEKEAHRLSEDPDNVIVRIQRTKYFTQYVFIPSPDGGNLGLGLGALLGPVNETVNTLMNQLIDAGTMSNNAGGFLGRGVKMKGGKMSFDPFEWKPVDSTGDDLRKNIFPLPVREPSNVLFQLLGILIEFGQKVGSATDIMTGTSPGQNTPAETSRNTIEQGMMLFSGIYARMYRSFREELNVLYGLNKLFLHTSPKFFELTEGPDAILAPDDYDGGVMRIFPSADPSAVSSEQRKQKIDKLAQAAMSPLGAKWDKDVVSKMWLEANEYSDVDLIMPDPKGPKAIQPPQDPKAAIKQAELAQKQKQHEDEMQLAIAELQDKKELTGAKVIQLQAQAAKLAAEAQGVESGHMIAAIEMQIGAAKLEHEKSTAALQGMLKMHELVLKKREMDHNEKMDKIEAAKPEPKHAAAK